MNLKSRLFKKPWQHRDPEVRAQAVRESDDPEIKSELARLAQFDEAAEVRLAALKRINSEAFWLDARLRESTPAILEAADAYLAREVPRAEDSAMRAERLQWFARIDSVDLVRRMAVDARDVELRRAAIQRITAQGFLGDCYVGEADTDLAAEILARIDQPSTLERLAERLRKTSKAKARAVTERLADLRAERGEEDPDHDQAEQLVVQIEILAKGQYEGDRQTRLEALQSAWSKIRQPEAVLERRFSGAAKIVRSALERPAAAPEVAPSADSSMTEAEDSGPHPALRQAAEHIRDTIRHAKRQLKAAELLASWDRAWNQVPKLGEAEQDLKDEILPLLRELQIQSMQCKDANQDEGGKPEVVVDEAEAFNARLDDIASCLDGGDILAAHELLRGFRSDFDRLPPRSRARRLGGRLQRMEGRLKEMRNWQHWSNNKHRDELIDQIEKLAESGQHPDAISAALKDARDEWQRLEKLEVLPGDRKRYAAPPGQWRRFQTACKQAFDTAKPYFEKRQEVQQENLEQLNKFFDQAGALADAEPVDTARLRQTMRAARLAIRRLDDLPPKTRGRSAARLRDLLDRMSQRLEQGFEQIELTKKRLITEAKALAHEKDIKTAIDKAKALQAQWQAAGSGRRRVEQKLWEAFREPIDPLFEQIKTERDERRQADEESLAEMKALCEQAEALAKLPDEQLESAVGRISGVIDQWGALAGRPVKLNQRFEAAEGRFNKRLADLREKERNRAVRQLEQLAASVQQLWNTRLQQPSADLADQLPALDETIEAKDQEIVNSLLARARQLVDPTADLEALTQEVAANSSKARQIVVEAEFLCGAETPEGDRSLRMDYQVRRLAKRMSDRDQYPDLETELDELILRWHASLPLPPDDYQELSGRFASSRQLIERMVGK